MAKGKVQKMAEEVDESDITQDEFREPEMKQMQKREGVLTVTEGSTIWNFKKAPLFIGRPTGDIKIIRDKESDDPEATKILGYIFEDEDGDKWIIGNSYAVHTSMDTLIVNPDGEEAKLIDLKPLVQIEWQGKTRLKSGKTANRFEIDILEW